MSLGNERLEWFVAGESTGFSRVIYSRVSFVTKATFRYYLRYLWDKKSGNSFSLDMRFSVGMCT